jgi:hypothetical protein
MEAVHIKVKLTKAIDEALVNRGLLAPHLLREHETEALVASKRMKKRCMEIGNGGKAQCPMTASGTTVVFLPSGSTSECGTVKASAAVFHRNARTHQFPMPNYQ